MMSFLFMFGAITFIVKPTKKKPKPKQNSPLLRRLLQLRSRFLCSIFVANKNGYVHREKIHTIQYHKKRIENKKKAMLNIENE